MTKAVSLPLSPKHVRRVAILYGGWSGEREVSLSSGQSMYEALTQSKTYEEVTLIDVQENALNLVQAIQAASPEVIINGLHGIGGEDGVVQGVLEMLQIPYTHSGVEASALAMDKFLSRQILRAEGVPVPETVHLSAEELKHCAIPFAFPWIVKPRDDGSSLGVAMIHSREEQQAYAEHATSDDLLVEKRIQGKEVQVALLDDEVLGAIEIRYPGEIFDYHAKYTPGVAQHIMPAEVSETMTKRLEALTLKACQSLGCRGAARVDFIVTEEEAFLLEINTQPGMTPNSLVPDIARYRGISYVELIQRLIESALAKAHR